MPDQPGLTSKDFREQHQVATLRKNGGSVVSAVDPLQQVFEDTRKASAIKMMTQQDRSLDVELLKLDNERLKTEIDNEQLKEARGGATVAGNPHMEFLYRQLDQVQKRLDDAQSRAEAAQAAVLEDRLRMLQDELARMKNVTPEDRDEIESALAVVDKSLALADRLRPPAREIVDRGPDPALRRFELTLDADREARKLEAEERRQQLQIDLQLKRESLAREEARLDKQAQSQERFLTDTVPKLLQLGQQLVETLTARLGQVGAAAPIVAPAVRAEVANEPTPIGRRASAANPKEAIIPDGAASMTCQVPGCGALIIYRPGAAEVFCSSCGALYTNDAPEDEVRAKVAERGEANPVQDARSWADAQREERYGAAADNRAESDPAIPA